MDLEKSTSGYLQQLSGNGLKFVFDMWYKRCTKCISVEGDYVEKS